MIDIQSELFTKIATAVRAQFSNAFVTPEYVSRPPKFPTVFIQEVENTVDRAYMDSGAVENCADLVYQVDVYSDRGKGKMDECRTIAAYVDAQFAHYGFVRSFVNQVPNLNDATVYRITARYRAVVDKNKYIYRR